MKKQHKWTYNWLKARLSVMIGLPEELEARRKVLLGVQVNDDTQYYIFYHDCQHFCMEADALMAKSSAIVRLSEQHKALWKWMYSQMMAYLDELSTTKRAKYEPFVCIEPENMADLYKYCYNYVLIVQDLSESSKYLSLLGKPQQN